MFYQQLRSSMVVFGCLLVMGAAVELQVLLPHLLSRAGQTSPPTAVAWAMITA